MIKTTQSQVDINDVLDTGRFDFEKLAILQDGLRN